MRRQINGDEVRIGYGNKSLSLRGGMTIGVVMGLLLLIAVGYLLREQDRMRMELPGQMDKQHREIARAIDGGFRLQTCVLALTVEERIAWRLSPAPRQWLVGMCPGLLLPASEPLAP